MTCGCVRGLPACALPVGSRRLVASPAPRHVFFGWKNFYIKDHPVLSPRQAMARTRMPVMISYQ